MNTFEQGICQYISKPELAFLKTITIGIAGAGGLGSNCAAILVRCGFVQFVIADYDSVEGSNLNRQFFFSDQEGQYKVNALSDNLKKINPAVQLQLINKKMETPDDLAVFQGCDAVIEAFDGATYKKMIVETFLQTNKLLVAASGIAGSGAGDGIITKKIKDRFFLVGDMVSEVGENNPPFAPHVTIAAARQADIVYDYYRKKWQESIK